jgi:hypothetical protein
VSDLYNTDILAWSERQANLLRLTAKGERVNDQAILRDLKAEAWPVSREVSHSRAEARPHCDEAREADAPRWHAVKNWRWSGSIGARCAGCRHGGWNAAAAGGARLLPGTAVGAGTR